MCFQFQALIPQKVPVCYLPSYSQSTDIYEPNVAYYYNIRRRAFIGTYSRTKSRREQLVKKFLSNQHHGFSKQPS